MPVNRPATKILVDGGDPEETLRVKTLLGFLDGQTTNPTLVAKNPDVQRRITSDRKLTREEQKQEYKEIVRKISPLVGTAGVSIEVFADFNTTAEQMLAQGEEMFSWIPNAYIKYPCIREGLRAAKMSVERNMRVNMTLCFSQSQAAAVYAATKGSKQPVYVSPLLVASLRRLDHLLYAFALKAELATAPAKILEQWATAGFPLPDPNYQYEPVDAKGKTLRSIPYEDLNLNASWESLDLKHELTDKGIEKFVADYKRTLAPAA